ncbi:MAG: beta-ketoacyl-[acyl-carrier-protein] synthase family protein [Bacteroidales bacterium]|nr:beta-ketoacyl-[acyl-carrier-protein] synthase family protein [Bacteroidales bacterium]
MPERVFITGCGVITAIGDNLEENLRSLQAGVSGIGEIRLLETLHRGKLPAAEIRHTDRKLAEMLGLPMQDGLTRTALLAMIAADEAVRHACCNLGDRWRTGLVSGSTVGGMVTAEKYYLDYLSNDTRNAWIEGNDCSESTERIARRLGIRQYVSTINTACSSSANAIMCGVQLIRAGLLDRVVAGGTDALSMFTLNGFNTLMIYDREPCRPFDDSRNGLNLGEGAAYLVLEPERTLKGRNPLCEVTGFGNTTDAFHQTALSPEGTGAYMAMKTALERSGISPEQVSYINVHGTATVNNDLSEGKAIEHLFGIKVPPASSTKSNTGHMLGASGAAEAVYSVLSILHDTIWPNLRFVTPMQELHFAPAERYIHGSGVRHVLSNSFGFGGNNTSLVLSKC